MTGIFLMSTLIVFGIAAVPNCVNIVLAQFSPNTGQPSTSLSPPTIPSRPSLSNDQPAEVNSSPSANITAPAENSTIIGPSPGPTGVGPSSIIASPITCENQGNVNTGITPSGKGSLEKKE
jgi:hypothetical protein